MKRAEAFIIHQTQHGKRLFPATTDEADKLVEAGEAKKLRKGLYQGTKPGQAPTQKTRKLSTPSTKAKRS